MWGIDQTREDVSIARGRNGQAHVPDVEKKALLDAALCQPMCGALKIREDSVLADAAE